MVDIMRKKRMELDVYEKALEKRFADNRVPF
jgi:hypothetical protein